MQHKLTPEISYMIALYSQLPSEDGIGVCSFNEGLAVLFASESLRLKLTAPGKILYKDDERGKKTVFFYNSKLEKFFKKILKEREERFRFINDFSSSYFAGVFDCCFSVVNGKLGIGKYNLKDALALDRLGFNAQKLRGTLIVGKPVEFLRFIQGKVKIKKDIVEDLLKKAKK
jgi:hypothetical protein